MTLMASLDKLSKLRKIDIVRFGTWNVRSFCKAVSLVTVVKELSKFEPDLVGLLQVRWDKGSALLAGSTKIFQC
jgi:hypothetical protein